MSTNPHNPYLMNRIKNLFNREKQKKKETIDISDDPIDKIFNYNAHIVKPQKTLDNFAKPLSGSRPPSVIQKKKLKDFKEISKKKIPSKRGSAIDDDVFKSAFMKSKDSNINEDDYIKDLKALQQLKSRQMQMLNEQKEKKKDNVNELVENLKKKEEEPIVIEDDTNIFEEIFHKKAGDVEQQETNHNHKLANLIKNESEKNKKLEDILMGAAKPKFSITPVSPQPKQKETNEEDKANDAMALLNPHKNPLRKSTNENFYKYYKFSKNEIFEKVLDFSFYSSSLPAENIPDTFKSDSHYKYAWLTNFFNELKATLLSDKAESNEVNNYIEMDVCVNLLYATDIDDNISVFRVNTNKKLNDLKKKILKENDLVALFPSTIKIPQGELTFKNEAKRFYFIGIVNINEQNEIFIRVHSKNAIKFDLKSKSSSNLLYSVRYLSSLTSSLREYNAVLNLELSNFTGILQAKDLFNKSAPEDNSFNQKRTTFIQNIQRCSVFNMSQTDAILKAAEMRTKDILLIQGPPGTGKTHTILGLLSLFLINNDGKILICAPSNTAIDEISARIARKGLLNHNLQREEVNFIRFGLYDRKEKEAKYLNTSNGRLLQNYSLENLSDARFKSRLNSINNELDNITRRINELSKAPSSKSSFELNELKSNRHNLLLSLQDIKMTRKNYEYDLLSKTRILCTTLNSSGSERIKKMHINFDYLVIDEACQCVEPSALIPLCHQVKKLIMVGDHMQLPATVFCDTAAKTRYNRSLFERLIDNQYPRNILTIQYRMHPNIREFIGSTFYDNHLTDDEGSSNALKKDPIYTIVNDKMNFAFFDIKYGKEHFDADKGRSYSNNAEADFVLSLIRKINERIEQNNTGIYHHQYNNEDYFSKENNTQITLKRYKYAIIAPYKSQMRLILDELRKSDLYQSIDIEVNTVDSFQGQERDIVLFTTVRSNFQELGQEKSSIGFLNDFRRMNVGLSRAKLACFIIGDSSTLTLNSYWKKLLDYCRLRQSFIDVAKEEEAKMKMEKIFIKKEMCPEMEDGEIRDKKKKYKYLGKKMKRELLDEVYLNKKKEQ